MGYNIRKNWTESFSLLTTKPIVVLPFFVIAFLESLALELVYFSPRKPLAYIANPIIQKFFGTAFVHYPANLVILPRLFFYVQVAIYIFIGVLLTAISVGIVKNIRLGLPLRANALIKNALKCYASFFIYGLFAIIVIFLLRRGEMFVFTKAMGVLSKHLPQGMLKLIPFIFASLLFLSTIILQVFLILAVPIIVIKKKMIFKALWESIVLGFRNFLSLFILIFMPLVIYLPLTLLRTGATKLIGKTFPEINLCIAIVGIILTAFVECFVIVCATQFLLERERAQYPYGHK